MRRDHLEERSTAAKKNVFGLMRLWPFLYPYRLRVLLAGLALIVAACGVLAIGQGLRRVIDLGFGSHGGPAFLDQALVGLLLVVAI